MPLPQLWGSGCPPSTISNPWQSHPSLSLFSPPQDSRFFLIPLSSPRRVCLVCDSLLLQFQFHTKRKIKVTSF
jgi:hypothetical protein